MLIRKKPAKWRVNSYYVQQEFEKGEFTRKRGWLCLEVICKHKRVNPQKSLGILSNQDGKLTKMSTKWMVDVITLSN